jgi:hypothetical protein
VREQDWSARMRRPELVADPLDRISPSVGLWSRPGDRHQPADPGEPSTRSAMNDRSVRKPTTDP